MSHDGSGDERRVLGERAGLSLAAVLLAVLLDGTVTSVSWWLLVALAVPLVEPVRRTASALAREPDVDGDLAAEALGTLAAAGVGFYLIAWTGAHWWIGLACYVLALRPLVGLAAGAEELPRPTRTVATTLVLGAGLLTMAVPPGTWPVGDLGTTLAAGSPWSVWFPMLLVGLPLLHWYAGRRPASAPEPSAA